MDYKIILGGILRGSAECHLQLAQIQEQLNAKIYVSSYEIWGNMPFEYEFVYTPMPTALKDMCFNYNTHQHANKYIIQWSHLNNCYRSFADVFDNSVIIKYRNDLYITDDINYTIDIFKNQPYSDLDLFTPAIEFHEERPFDINKVCNDQIYCMSTIVANKIFELPYNLRLFYPHKYSIEESLNQYIKQEQLKINTFSLNYEKRI